MRHEVRMVWDRESSTFRFSILRAISKELNHDIGMES